MNWIYQKTLKCSSTKNCKIYLFWNLFCSLTIVAKMVKRYRAEMQTAANWIQKWLLIAQRIVLLLRKDFYSFSSKIYALAGKQGCSVRLNPCPLSRTPSIFIYSDLLKFDFRQVWSLDYLGQKKIMFRKVQSWKKFGNIHPPISNLN